MSGIRRAEHDLALFATPVENLFVMEYLSAAPGEFVKVYLYGLWLSHYGTGEETLQDIAQGAGVEEDVALSAFLYWERMKLVEITSRDPLEVQYRCALHRMMENTQDQQTLYRYAAFHQKLQSLFGAGRLLTSFELDQMDRWVEEDGFSQEAVCIMCEYAQIRWGVKVTLAELREVFELFRERDALSPEKAREVMLLEKSLYETAKKILRSFTIRREPTQEEIRICREAAEQGMEPGAMLAAAAQAGTARNPGFSYLKPILSNLIQAGCLTKAQAQEYFAGEKKHTEELSRLLRAMGFTGAAPSALISTYRAWMEYGFSQDALETLCRSLSARGRGTPEDLTRTLARLREEGVRDDQGLLVVMQETEEAYSLAAGLLQIWGESRAALPREAAYARRFMRDGFSTELMQEAASQASGAERPFAYMKRILDNWKAAGVATVQQAAALRSVPVQTGRGDAPADTSVHFALEHGVDKNQDYFVDLFAEDQA